MTTHTATASHVAGSGFGWMLSDIREMTRRNLIRYYRQPRLLIFSTIQPVMFVVLFVYVFGGAIQTPEGDYVNYLLPAIFIQTVLFGAMQTGVGLAEDLNKGLIDRFRSLPMARSAVLAGRTIADAIRNVLVIAVMIGVGYIVGFRVQTDPLSALGAVGVALLFSLAVMWIMATIGLAVRDVETTQIVGMISIFPLTFASSAFVPVATMPGWLQAFAKISPVSLSIDAVRGLMVTGDYTAALWQALLWIAGILLVFVPLAVSRYRRIAS